jgi:hypothetical protein
MQISKNEPANRGIFELFIIDLVDNSAMSPLLLRAASGFSNNPNEHEIKPTKQTKTNRNACILQLHSLASAQTEKKISEPGPFPFL